MSQTMEIEPEGAPPRNGRRDRTEMRRAILGAFSQRARQDGIRRVVMIDLARELGMSSRTLYKVFPSKSELVSAMVQDWMRRFEDVQVERIAHGDGVLGRVLVALGGWLEFTSRFHPSFWSELARDYPEADAYYRRQVRRYVQAGRELLEPLLRPGVQPDIAFGQLAASIQFASDPVRCEKLGVTRLQAVVQVVQVWARGALRRETQSAEAGPSRPG